MADVFISYAREVQEFVRKLQEALEEHDRKTWIDWKDIPLTAKWKEEVFVAIENADSFAAIISPDSIVSKPCQEELDHAAHNNKRMVPLWHRDVTDEDVPPELAVHQYVYHFDTTSSFTTRSPRGKLQNVPSKPATGSRLARIGPRPLGISATAGHRKMGTPRRET